MARINIDMHFFSDERVEYLAQAIGELKLTTEARLLRIWASCYRDRTASRTEMEVNRAGMWLNPKRSLMDMLVAADLAEAVGDHEIRMRGIEDRIGYLCAASERGRIGGEASAKARRQKTGSAVPKNARNSPKVVRSRDRRVPFGRPFGATEAQASALPNPPSPSYSLAPLASPSKTLRQSGTSSLVLKNTEDTKKLRFFASGQAVVKTYVDEFRKRYKTSPAIDGACRGEVKRLLEGVGAERACLLIQAYLQLEDPKYLAKCHDLTSLRMDLQRVSVALDQGKATPNKKTWRELVEEEDAILAAQEEQ